MPETPGQIAYMAAWRVHQELYPKAHRTPWRELHPAHKRGWEAAAKAVLVAWVRCPALFDREDADDA